MRLTFSSLCEKECVVGKGASAVVFLGVVRDSGGCPIEYVAVKSAPLPAASRMLMREKLTMDDLHGCAEVLQCFGDELVLDANNRDATPTYNMYLEYAHGGSLDKHIRSVAGCVDNGCGGAVGLAEEAVQGYTRSILRGLAHIHRRGYVHCDVKPDNILVWSSSDVKIGDFGLSKKIGRKEGGIRGTPAYMSPEALTRAEYEPPMDIWSLGCTVVEMLTGEVATKLPKDPRWRRELMLYGVSQLGIDLKPPEVPDKLSPEGKDFLSRCFARDPKDRWTAHMLLKHPFVSPGYIWWSKLNIINRTKLPTSNRDDAPLLDRDEDF